MTASWASYATDERESCHQAYGAATELGLTAGSLLLS